MEEQETIDVTDILYDLRITGTATDDLPEELKPADLSAGYAVQDALVSRLERRHGGVGIGYKIACTNTHAQQLLNTDAPVYGRLSSCFSHPSPARIHGSNYCVLGIEPEFAFEIKKDVPTSKAPFTADAIADYVAALIPAIEFVGHRLSDWSRFDGPTLVADNAVHQAWIRGEAVTDWRHLDLAAHPVRLLVNGEVALEGTGANVLGHPLNALAWLANELPERGRALNAGDLVTTGTCTNVYSAKIGDRIEANFGELGNVLLELV